MDTLPAADFGTLLRRHRRAAGLTQEELAERAGISVDAISALERGVSRAPHKDTIELLAEALQLLPEARAKLAAAARGRGAPAPATATLPRAATLPGDRPVPLVGRAEEVALLERQLAGEEPPCLLLVGEPGIGKSRLLAEASQRARTRAWTVLEGGCHPRSRQEPFAPLVGTLAHYLHHRSLAQQRDDLRGCSWLVRLLPELVDLMPPPAVSWQVPPEQERRLMFAAVQRFLTNIASPVGVLLILDDLQWAGADALDLLASLLRAPLELPLRVLGAYRSTEVQPADPVGALLAELAHAHLVREQRLGLLAPQEATSLLTGLLEAAEVNASERQQHLLARAGCLPFFLVSYVQALRVGALTDTETDVPWDVAQSIRQRVRVLAAVPRELLGAAAIIGRRAERLVLAAVADPEHEEREILAALEALCQARLLLEEGEEAYQFPHDLIREVVLADLSTARRARLQRRVAAALEQLPGEPPIERLAYHYTQAGELEKAVVYLERAGDRAWARHATAEAEGYYRDLLAHLERLGRGQAAAHTRERLAEVLNLRGQYEEALACFTQAEGAYWAAGDHEGRWRVLAAMGNIYANSLRANEGLALLQPVLEAARPNASTRALAALQSAVALLYFNAGQEEACLALARRTEDLARTAGDERLLFEVQYNYAGTLEFLGQFEEAQPLFEDLLARAERAGDLFYCGLFLRCLSEIYLNRNALRQGQTFCNRALEVYERLGEPFNTAICRVLRAHSQFWTGEWSAAREDLEQAQEVLRQMRPPDPLMTCDALIALGRLALVQGQWEEAGHFLDQAQALAAQGGHFLRRQRLVQTELAEQDLLAGRPRAAQARLEHLLAQPGLPQLDREWVSPLLAWARLDVGTATQAEGLLSQAGEQAQRDHRLRGEARRIQALVSIQQQRWDEAQVALEEAVRLARSLATPYPEAKALYTSSLLHQAKGEPNLARQRLEAALAILTRLGERLYAEHVEWRISLLER